MSTHPNEYRWTDYEGKRELEQSFSVQSFVTALACMLVLQPIANAERGYFLRPLVSLAIS